MAWRMAPSSRLGTVLFSFAFEFIRIYPVNVGKARGIFHAIPEDLVRPVEEDRSLKHFDIDYSNYRRQAFSDYSPNGAIYIAKPRQYLVQKHFYGIRLSERWKYATRISMLSIGLGALTGMLAPKVAEKYAEGVSFRLISVDPAGESASDTINSKLNSFMRDLESEYLQICQTKAYNLFDRITKKHNDQSKNAHFFLTPALEQL